jgi:hypothetical protein
MNETDNYLWNGPTNCQKCQPLSLHSGEHVEFLSVRIAADVFPARPAEAVI